MLRFTALALIGCLLGTVATAERLDGSRSLSETEYGYSISADVARLGRVSQRFEVRPGDCSNDANWSDCDNDRERSEFSVDYSWQYGNDIWIGYSIFLPSDFETSNRVRTTVGQIHQAGGPTGEAGGLRSFPPMMQMEMRRNQYYMGVHILTGSADNVYDITRDFNLIEVSQMRGRWTDIVIHFDTSNESELLEVFVNGEKKASIADWINFKPGGYYFKYGIYRSFVTRHGGPMPTQVLYIDEVRLGKSLESVSPDENRPVD